MRYFVCLLAVAFTARAETHRLTLKQAIDRALAQNPEVMMARLDEQKATLGVDVARNPFSPHMSVGSGLAYSNGFPLSIEGSAPAAFQAKANEALFDRPQRYAVSQARENARGAGFAVASKNDEIAFRVASAYIDADRANRLADAAAKQVESLQKVLDTLHARVEEGRELPITAQEANVNLLKARQRLIGLQSDLDTTAHSLAALLGYSASDEVAAVDEERAAPAVPSTEEAALDQAVHSNNELKQLESSYEAKALEIKGDKSQRLPRVELIAQYALLTKYSHYDEYFAHFQRNNGQVGASIQIPVLLGLGAGAALAQAEADQQHLRSQAQEARNRITLDIHQSYLDIRRADAAREVAQADLDLARSQLSVVLAQLSEGRASLRQVEEARFTENEKWIAFYEAQFSTERARLNLLRETGTLSASLR